MAGNEDGHRAVPPFSPGISKEDWEPMSSKVKRESRSFPFSSQGWRIPVMSLWAGNLRAKVSNLIVSAHHYVILYCGFSLLINVFLQGFRWASIIETGMPPSSGLFPHSSAAPTSLVLSGPPMKPSSAWRSLSCHWFPYKFPCLSQAPTQDILNFLCFMWPQNWHLDFCSSVFLIFTGPLLGPRGHAALLFLCLE